MRIPSSSSCPTYPFFQSAPTPLHTPSPNLRHLHTSPRSPPVSSSSISTRISLYPSPDSRFENTAHVPLYASASKQRLSPSKSSIPIGIIFLAHDPSCFSLSLLQTDAGCFSPLPVFTRHSRAAKRLADDLSLFTAVRASSCRYDTVRQHRNRQRLNIFRHDIIPALHERISL